MASRGSKKRALDDEEYEDENDEYVPGRGSRSRATPSAAGGAPPSKPALGASTDSGHRASCHRCGNLRKRNVRCSSCPHTYCQRCAEKVMMEYGATVFAGGCPVCKHICCCSDPRDTPSCDRLFHCYKRCPGAKNSGSTGAGDTMNELSRKRPLLEPSEVAPLVNDLIEGPPLARPPTVRHMIGALPLPLAQSTINAVVGDLRAERYGGDAAATPPPSSRASTPTAAAAIASLRDSLAVRSSLGELSPHERETEGRASALGSARGSASPRGGGGGRQGLREEALAALLQQRGGNQPSARSRRPSSTPTVAGSQPFSSPDSDQEFGGNGAGGNQRRSSGHASSLLLPSRKYATRGRHVNYRELERDDEAAAELEDDGGGAGATERSAGAGGACSPTAGSWRDGSDEEDGDADEYGGSAPHGGRPSYQHAGHSRIAPEPRSNGGSQRQLAPGTPSSASNRAAHHSGGTPSGRNRTSAEEPAAALSRGREDFSCADSLDSSSSRQGAHGHTARAAWLGSSPNVLPAPSKRPRRGGGVGLQYSMHLALSDQESSSGPDELGASPGPRGGAHREDSRFREACVLLPASGQRERSGEAEGGAAQRPWRDLGKAMEPTPDSRIYRDGGSAAGGASTPTPPATSRLLPGLASPPPPARSKSASSTHSIGQTYDMGLLPTDCAAAAALPDGGWQSLQQLDDQRKPMVATDARSGLSLSYFGGRLAGRTAADADADAGVPMQDATQQLHTAGSSSTGSASRGARDDVMPQLQLPTLKQEDAFHADWTGPRQDPASYRAGAAALIEASSLLSVERGIPTGSGGFRSSAYFSLPQAYQPEPALLSSCLRTEAKPSWHDSAALGVPVGLASIMGPHEGFSLPAAAAVQHAGQGTHEGEGSHVLDAVHDHRDRPASASFGIDDMHLPGPPAGMDADPPPGLVPGLSGLRQLQQPQERPSSTRDALLAADHGNWRRSPSDYPPSQDSRPLPVDTGSHEPHVTPGLLTRAACDDAFMLSSGEPPSVAATAAIESRAGARDGWRDVAAERVDASVYSTPVVPSAAAMELREGGRVALALPPKLSVDEGLTELQGHQAFSIDAPSAMRGGGAVGAGFSAPPSLASSRGPDSPAFPASRSPRGRAPGFCVGVSSNDMPASSQLLSAMHRSEA